MSRMGCASLIEGRVPSQRNPDAIMRLKHEEAVDHLTVRLWSEDRHKVISIFTDDSFSPRDKCRSYISRHMAEAWVSYAVKRGCVVVAVFHFP